MVIYCITNLLNGKQYIGLTTQALNIRWAEHLSRSRYKQYSSAIHSAIRKYGKENFIIEPIACACTIEDLKALEIILIEQYNTFRAGYNLTEGGDFKVVHQDVKNKISKSKIGHSVSKETREKLAEHNRLKWLVIHPSGQEVITDNLKSYSKDININYYSLVATHNKNRPCYGYKVKKIGI